MTHKQTQQSIRSTLRKLVSDDRPSLIVQIETRDSKGKRKQIGNGIVSGWANNFATVWVVDQPNVVYEFAWSTVELAIKNSCPLLV